MNIHESQEDYLERILILKNQKDKVISLDVANSMGFSKASVSRAVKNLKENGYLVVENDGELNFTQKGYEIASRIYDRHVTLSKFFEQLGVPEDIALADACKVEHDISPETFAAIKDQLK